MHISLLAAVFAVVVVALAVVTTVLFRRMRKLRSEIEVLVRSQATAAEDNLAALCAGAVGIDERFARLEQRQRRLAERQDRIESSQERDRPYGEAIRLVHEGASASELVRSLDLTRNEAELIVSMHGVDEAV